MSGPTPFVFEAGVEAKRFAPATERNRDAITEVLRHILPSSGTVLEIASGTGEHIVHFAARFPDLIWQPSDPDPIALASIAAWKEEGGHPNILPPLQLDAAADWNATSAEAIICINMVHISPWEATVGLLRNAARTLNDKDALYLYGPYRQKNAPASESNEEFDRSLKLRNPLWGLRYVEDVVAQAQLVGMKFEQMIEMPSNNLSLIINRS